MNRLLAGLMALGFATMLSAAPQAAQPATPDQTGQAGTKHKGKHNSKKEHATKSRSTQKGKTEGTTASPAK